ncbi:hypothetical protein [Faecalibacillus faecis]|uniref:hypothetical protein n=1 Tax=Faecalibacillus faecis TaxID=1982628 RepID=UPI003AB6B5E3
MRKVLYALVTFFGGLFLIGFVNNVFLAAHGSHMDNTLTMLILFFVLGAIANALKK